MDHEGYMRRALEIARGNPDAPFGCVIVDGASKEVLAEGLNDAERSPVLHGETDAILRLARESPAVEWGRTVLYTTAEPCPMCSGAIVWSGIQLVFFGTSIGTLRRLGLPQIDLSCDEVSRRSSFGGFEATGGVLEGECDRLFEEMARRVGV